MFEEMTQENIMERMLSRVDDKLDKREGSIIWDALAPAAAEISEQYAYMDMMLDELFPDTASYYYLVKHCAAIGITPFPATYKFPIDKFPTIFATLDSLYPIFPPIYRSISFKPYSLHFSLIP